MKTPDDRSKFAKILQLASEEQWGVRTSMMSGDPWILEPETDELFDILLERMPDGAEWIQDCRDFLRRCRTIGVAEVAAEAAEYPKISKALYQKFRLAGSFGMSPAAVDAWGRCLMDSAFASAPPRFKASLLMNAAVALLTQSSSTDGGDELSRAKDLLLDALKNAPSNPFRGMLMSTLGVCRLQEYKQSETLNILEEAIACHEEAIRLTPANSPLRVQHLFAYADALFQALDTVVGNNDETIETLIKVSQESVRLSRRQAGPKFPTLRLLSLSLYQRFKRKGQIDDLEHAVSAMEDSLSEVGAASAYCPEILYWCTKLWFLTAFETGKVGSIKNAKKRLAQGLRLQDLAPDLLINFLLLQGDICAFDIDHGYPDSVTEWENSARMAYRLSRGTGHQSTVDTNLARVLQALFLRTGHRRHLDEAIGLLREASRAEQDAESNGNCLAFLGNALHYRFDYFSEVVDLEESERVSIQSLGMPITEKNERARRLNSVAVMAREKYDLFDDIAYLNKAILVHEEALSVSVPGSHIAALSHHNLGFCFRQKYEAERKKEDLDRAIVEHQSAIDLSPEGWKELPGFLSNLASCLLDLYLLTHDEQTLQKAVSARHQALSSPNIAPGEVITLKHQLASALAIHGGLIGDATDLARSVELFREACFDGLLHPEEALIAASNWLRWAFSRGAWLEVVEAHGFLEDILALLVRRQLFRSAKERWLRDCQGQAMRAAYAMAKLGRVEDAIVVLERDRARIFSQALEANDARLRQIESKHPELFARLARNLNETTVLSRQVSLQPRTNNRSLLETRRLHAEFDDLIKDVRQVEGYEDFLLPADFKAIRGSVGSARTAYVGATTSGGIALIIDAMRCSVVWLDELVVGPGVTSGAHPMTAYFHAYFDWSSTASDESRTTWLNALDSVCNWLWTTLVWPLVEQCKDRPDLTLIPMGQLAFLPIHAAWTADASRPSGRLYTIDLLTINYVANARSIPVTATAVPETMLSVIVSKGQTGSELPGASWEGTTAAQLMKQPIRLEDETATREATLEALRHCEIAHFACHGSVDLLSPLDSRLRLWGNEQLTVRDIFELQLTERRLAVLSACESGLVGMALPDELVGMPMACSRAGFKGVIASLWSVEDHSTALLIARFFQHWVAEQKELDVSLKHAQIWLRDSTNAEKLAFMRGLDIDGRAGVHGVFSDPSSLEARAHSHPYFWAAFSLTGR